MVSNNSFCDPLHTNLYDRTERALLEPDPGLKCIAVAALVQDWAAAALQLDELSAPLALDEPGKPAQPALVDPRKLKRRSVASESGRIHFLHAFAHIEFNAINIALDAVYRFRRMPEQYIGDWLLVAGEEARHFTLLNNALIARGSCYGAFDAHSGLWDMVCKTRHDFLHRMAMVPRVMEARGLDVTPGIIERFAQVGDQAAVEILEIIYRDEIGHVRIGNHWFEYACAQRQVDVAETFQQLLDHYLAGKLRGPFNWPARLEAGFCASELTALEEGDL